MAMNLGAPQSDEAEVMMDINTTPLIDVMLVLIIMLIITIPAQLHSVSLDMPQPSASKPPAPPEVVRIDIAADGGISWNDQALPDRPALEARLAQAALQTTQPELHIHSHPKAPYAATAAVLAGAQRQGLKKLGVLGSERFSD